MNEVKLILEERISQFLSSTNVPEEGRFEVNDKIRNQLQEMLKLTKMITSYPLETWTLEKDVVKSISLQAVLENHLQVPVDWN